MDTKINHIKNLVYFAYIDGELHESEKKFIQHVGERLSINGESVTEIINSGRPNEAIIPKDEVLRFILLDDIFNVITSDGIIHDQEMSECKKLASELGFENDVIETLISKLQNHIQNGFVENRTSQFIKNELYRLTSKNYSDAKYN